ncbi:MAG: DUF4214 domain-containing protein [Pyrinomonadaceae bacterium]
MKSRKSQRIHRLVVFFCLVGFLAILMSMPGLPLAGARSLQRTTINLPAPQPRGLLKNYQGLGTTRWASEKYSNLFGRTGSLENQSGSQETRIIKPGTSQVNSPSAGGVCNACAGGSITCTGTIDATDPDKGGRLSVAGAVSTCASPTSCPGTVAGIFRYDSYVFTNTTGATACFTVTITNNCGDSLFSAAYSPGYQPANFCTNYLADIGFPVTSGGGPFAYSFNLTNTQRVVVVVHNRNTNLLCTGGTYTLNISPCPPATPTASNGGVAGQVTTSDGTPVAGTVVNLSGTQNRKTITDANGNYRFDNVETNGFYTVRPSRANYSFSPAERSFSQLGSSTEAAFTGSPTAASANPLDTPEYFVRQHYLDFLGREPDESGFNFWSDQILGCGSDVGCIERRTINVSAAYFLSIEFQQTGGLVDALYRASYGRAPMYDQFMPDTGTIARDVIVGHSGWEQQLATNKQAFVDAWVQRPEFHAAYDLLTNDRYVDSLIAHTGVNFTQGERDSLVNGLTFGTLTRADALRSIAENDRFVDAKRNEMFVMMQYYGYLQRDPDASGYAFWLNKLNEFNGNFEQAEMVKAFIVSGEYRDRFPR